MGPTYTNLGSHLKSNDFCSRGKKERMLIGLKTIECNYKK